MVLLAASLGRTSAQSDVNPTAAAIQTQIAELEATLTAIAGPTEPQGTPTASRTVEVGSFTLTFTGAERQQSLGDFADPPRGVYVLVLYTAINNGNQPESLPNPESFILVDGKDRTFTINWYGMGYLTSEYLTLGEAQPGLEYEAVVVYDVPKDAEDLTLRIEGTDFEFPLDP